MCRNLGASQYGGVLVGQAAAPVRAERAPGGDPAMPPWAIHAVGLLPGMSARTMGANGKVGGRRRTGPAAIGFPRLTDEEQVGNASRPRTFAHVAACGGRR